jgi:hypothetical protein
MADISSSIRIEDGFTEPLRNLAKAAWDVESGVTAVAKSLVSQEKEFESISERTKELGKNFSIAFGERLVGNIDMVLPAIKSVGIATTEMAKTSVRAVTEFATLSHGLGVSLAADITKASFIHPARLYAASMKELGTETKKYARAGFWGALATMRWRAINIVSMSAFHKMKDSYIKGFNALMESIGKSLDEINIGDKLEAQFGEAGNVARKRSYELANEIGESATMVSELAMKAGQEGIGTEHFERMMKLADKVGKLRQGETTESAASTLMSNIKNGHDASSIAQLFGGGQMMERQLRRAGYERALNRGDLDKALQIAEQIAEQAGLTDENYNKATNNLSQNYKKIMNTIDNVKRRLAETFNRTFAPTIEKIKKLLESNTFKTIVNVADWLMDKLGKFLNWFTESAVDNIHIIGVLLGVGIVSKVMFLIPKIKFLLVLATKLRGPIGWIMKGVTRIIGGIATIIAKHGILALKTKALAALKFAAPWALAAAAVGGIIFGVYKLSGSTKSFTEWLKDKFKTFSHIMASGYKFLQNVFTNVFIFFERVGSYIVELPALASAAFQEIVEELDKLTKKIKGQEIRPKVYIDKKQYESMTEEAKKALGKVYVERSSVPSLDGRGHGVQERYFYFGEEQKTKSKLDEILERIQANQTQYIDVWEGTDKALEEGWSATTDWLKKIFNQGEEQAKTEAGIKTDTGKIRQFNEQEEELRWLKAFSDRQIMSAYGNMTTTNNRTINMNGVSQNVMAEAYRRNRSTIPPRAALGM